MSQGYHNNKVNKIILSCSSSQKPAKPVSVKEPTTAPIGTKDIDIKHKVLLLGSGLVSAPVVDYLMRDQSIRLTVGKSYICILDIALYQTKFQIVLYEILNPPNKLLCSSFTCLVFVMVCLRREVHANYVTLHNELTQKVRYVHSHRTKSFTSMCTSMLVSQ